MQLCSLISRPLSFCVLGLMLASPHAEAARVEKVKGKQILIDGEGEELVEGDKYFILIDGKKKGVVQIAKSKNGKAIGKLTKGRAAVDATIEAARKAGDSADSGASEGGKKRRGSGGGAAPGLYVGAAVGYSMDSQSVKDAAGTALSMSGSGYSLKAFGDMPIGSRLGLIARVGIEQLSVKASVGTVSRKTEIMYATTDLLIRYSFTEGTFVPYVAGGFGLHFPVSKSSDVLDVPRIAATTVFFFDLGLNYAMSSKTILTAVAEYGMFPPSGDVSTSIMGIRGGVGFRF